MPIGQPPQQPGQPRWTYWGITPEAVDVYQKRRREAIKTVGLLLPAAAGVGIGVGVWSMKELIHRMFAVDFFNWPPKLNDPGYLKEIKDWHRWGSGAKA